MIIAKYAVDLVDTELGFIVAIITNVVLGAIFVLFRLFLDASRVGFDGLSFSAFVMAGVLNSYLGRFLLLNAVAKMGATRASAFVSTSPVFAAIFGWIFLDELMGLDRSFAIGMTLIGLVLLNYQRSGTEQSRNSAAPSVRAMLLLGLASSAAYGAGTAFRGVGVRLWSEPMIGTLIGALVGFFLQALVSARKRRELLPRLRLADRTGLILYFCVGITGITAQALSIVAMQYIPVAEVALITASTPLLVLPASLIFFPKRETVTWLTAFGLLLALTGVGYIVGQSIWQL